MLSSARISFLTATFLLVPLSTPGRVAAQYDGSLSLNWGAGDGFATWPDSGEVHLETAAPTGDLLYGVGDYEEPPGTRSLHFQAVDRSGEVRGDRACHDSTADFGLFTDESGGEAAIVDSSGSLLVGGWVNFAGDPSRLHALVARYEVDQTGCTLDESFSTDGFRLFNTQSYCDAESCLIVGLGEIRPETGAVGAPRIVALLRSTVAISNFRYFLIGLTLSGDLDPDFGAGTSGIREIGLAGLGTLRSDVAMVVDDLGRILVLVTRLEPNTTSDLDAIALRYTAAGDLDLDFSANGVLPVYDAGIDDDDDTVAADLLALPSEGHYYASVRRGTVNWALVRIDPEEETATNLFAQSTPAEFASQGDDRFLYAREAVGGDAFATHRLISTPTGYEQDATYGSEPIGFEPYDLDFGGGTGQEIVDFLLWAGRPIVVGNAFAASGDSSGFLMRAENSYIFADGFEGGSRARWHGY